MQRPKNPAREYVRLESVEFTFQTHSGEWYYEGMVEDAEVGFGRNGKNAHVMNPKQVQVNIRPTEPACKTSSMIW